MLPLSQLILLVILIIVALLLLNREATHTRTHWDEPPDDGNRDRK